MSMASSPGHPTWPAQQPHLPAPHEPRRRWPALTATAATDVGLVTTLITLAITNPHTTNTAAPVRSTVTETAGQPAPTPLPAAEADAQACQTWQAWQTTETLFTAAAVAQGVIPPGMTITDQAVQANPAWKAGVLRASDLYGQAESAFASQIAPGTSSMLAQVANTTVSSLHLISNMPARHLPG